MWFYATSTFITAFWYVVPSIFISILQIVIKQIRFVANSELEKTCWLASPAAEHQLQAKVGGYVSLFRIESVLQYYNTLKKNTWPTPPN